MIFLQKEMSTVSSPIFEAETRRRLNKGMRIANLIYQFLLVILGGMNALLISFNNAETINIPPLYFEISTVLLSIIPVIWTNMLNICKKPDVGLKI